MNKAEMIERIAQAAEISKSAAERAVDAMVAAIKSSLKKGDMVTLVFFSLVPVGVPIIFLGLHIGVSFLQAYIFVLLTTVYLSGAVAEEH